MGMSHKKWNTHLRSLDYDKEVFPTLILRALTLYICEYSHRDTQVDQPTN